MRESYLFLACLVCIVHGRRVRMLSGWKSHSHESASAVSNPNLGALAGLLFRCNPSAAFELSIGTLSAPHVAASSLLTTAKPSVNARCPRPLHQVMTGSSRLQTLRQTYLDLVNKGLANSKCSSAKTLISNIMGGFQVGIGGLVCLTVCGNVPGVLPGFLKFIFGALFPVCLLLVLNTGTQLFTDNAATMSAAFFERKIGKSDVYFNWMLAYLGNIIGCGSVALIADISGLLAGGTAEIAACEGMALAGLGAGTFGQMLVRGIMGNYLVTMGVLFAMMSKDMIGRYIGIFIPVSTFLICGFEHSITNLFLLPASMLAGAPLTLKDVLIKNLIPVTIGNIIGAVVLVSAYLSVEYGRLGGKRMLETTENNRRSRWKRAR